MGDLGARGMVRVKRPRDEEREPVDERAVHPDELPRQHMSIGSRTRHGDTRRACTRDHGRRIRGAQAHRDRALAHLGQVTGEKPTYGITGDV